MKAKTFILTFLMMFSSFAFGQASQGLHWAVENPTQYQDPLIVYAGVTLDGTVQTNTNLELGAFCGDEVRGCVKLQLQAGINKVIAYLSVYSNNPNDVITFKLYNHENGKTYNNTLSPIRFGDYYNGTHNTIGSVKDTYAVNFATVAEVNGEVFDALQSAIDACTTGENTVTLLADNISENVTVVQAQNKKVTIEGQGKTYKGTITVDGKSAAYATAALTINNVNFDATNIAKDASINLGGNNSIRYTSNVTVNGCTFTGTDNTKVGIKNYTGGCKYLTVTESEATGLHSLVQVKGVDNLTIENVTIEGKNGIAVGPSTNVVVKNSTIEATGYGVRADGTGAYDMTLEGNTIKANNPIIVRKTTGAYELTVNNCQLTANKVADSNNKKGYEVVMTAGDDEEKFVVPTAAATAVINGDVKTYGLEAEVNGVCYTRFETALAAANANDEITILQYVLRNTPVEYNMRADEGIMIKVSDKEETTAFLFDANAKVENANITANKAYAFYVDSNATLTIVDGTYNTEVSVAYVVKGSVEVLGGDYTVKPFEGSYEYLLNCEDNNFKNGNAKIYVKGGKFHNWNPEDNKAEGEHTNFCAEGFTSVALGNNVYEVTGAVAKIGETYYATFDEAYTAATKGDVIELLQTAVITNSKPWINYSKKQITVKANLGTTAFRVQDGAYVWFGGMTIESNDYCITVGAADGTSDATVEIWGGTYNGETSAISVTKGEVKIIDGTFKVEPYQGSYEYTINCVDANYKNETAVVSIQGGKFYNFNPMNNAAEGTGTNFLVGGHATVKGEDDYWTVVDAAASIKAGNTTTYYATLDEALAKVAEGNTLTLLANATKANTINVNFDLTINGNGKTLTYTGSDRAFQITGGEVVINNLTVNMPNAEEQNRGINLYNGNTNNAINVTLNKVTVNGGKAYAVNIGGGKNNTLTINESTLTGYAAINVNTASVNHTITVDKSTLNGKNHNNLYHFGAVVVDGENEHTLTITNSIVTTENLEGVTNKYYQVVVGIGCDYSNVQDDIEVVVRNVKKNGIYHIGLVSAVEDEKEGEIILLANATGAGLKVNRDVVINLNGKTYTINQAVGSAGTESQGFQLLKGNNVTIKNGNIAVAEGANVVWMFNAYANLKLENVTIDCANMAAPKEGTDDKNYVLVVNNGGSATPNVEYSNVTINNFEGTPIYLDPKTSLEAGEGLETQIEKDAKYAVAYNNGQYYLVSGKVAYRADVTDKDNREGIAVLLKEVYAKESVVVKVYNGETLMFTCTRRDIDDEGKVMFPVDGNTTANIVLWGKESGSWINEIHVAPTEFNVPDMIEVYADGELVDTYTNEAGTVLGTNREKYLALDCVKKAVAQVGETKYLSLTEAIAAAQSGQTVTFIANINENVIVNKNLTFEGAEKSYTGTMTVNNVSFTVQNVNFVKGQVYKNKNTGSNAKVTIKNCDFDGQGLDAYAVNLGGTNNIVIENVTAKDYGYGLLQVPSSNASLSVKDVTISNVKYGLKVDYSNGVTLENVKIDGAEYGIYDSNHGAKTYTVKGCEISSIVIWERAAAKTSTFKFEGTNTVGTLSTSQYAKYVLADVNSTLAAPANFDVTTPVEGYAVQYANGIYSVVANVVLNNDKQVKYPSLAEAIAAASAGNTLVLLNNVTENVTITKDLTIDGANKKYTGNIAVKGSQVDVTVKNVNFVDYEGYAITTNTIKSITVEDCTVKNYGFGFLYSNKSTPTVVVNNVTVENCNYGMHYVYGSTATLENVTMTNVNTGLYIQNYAAKTINVKNSTITSIVVWERDGYSAVQTFNFEGENTVGSFDDSQCAKYVITAKDATITAPAGAAVTTTVAEHTVKHINGVYTVVPSVAKVVDAEGKYVDSFASIQDAIDAAQNGETVVLLQNVTLADKDIFTAGGLKVMINVEGKDITLDLNEKTIELDYNGSSYSDLMTVVLVADGASLTVEGNGTINFEENSRNCGYLFFKRGYNGHLTINNGSFRIYDPEDSMIYTNDGNDVTINGGNFVVDLTGTRSNGCPWIFNTKGNNDTGVTVNGGTFNADINHQYWAFEVFVPETLALKINEENGTWTVVDAEAYVVEKVNNKHDREVGYATLAEALEVAMNNNYTDVVLADYIATEASYKINKGETIVLDLNGQTIAGTDNATGSFGLFTNQGDLTIKGEGTITLTATHNRAWNAYSSVISNTVGGKLTVNGGTIEHLGNTDMAYGIDNLTNGKGTYAETVVNGGTVKSTYRAIRQFLNGVEAQNILTVNGGTIAGTNKSIWMQDPSKNANSGKLTVGKDAKLIGDAYLTVTAGSTEWPVEVAIAAEALQGESKVSTSNVPATYAVEKINNIWTVVRVNTQKLTANWNWFSTYLNIELSQLQAALGTSGLHIKHYDYYTEYDETYGWLSVGANALTSIEASKMYMIETSAEIENFNLTGKLVDPSEVNITLNQGWNWIGYPMNEEYSVSEVIANSNLTPVEGDQIKSHLDGFVQYFEYEGQGYWGGTLNTLKPGVGYMYESKDNIVKTFNFAYLENKTRGAVKDNVTAENNYWVPAAAQFANNMTMVATLDIENANYEVAAFVNGEVRGSARPIYVEALDAYMFFLTIHGDDVEEMTFKCYDLTTGEEFALSNVMNYSSNAVVGSIKNPYLLSRGTVGLNEVSSNFNIYPNPTTTDMAIILTTTCDKVEVFNALGVKVAEYQNVDSIDAFETAGIYVIRVTNNGNVQHCRLVVK